MNEHVMRELDRQIKIRFRVALEGFHQTGRFPNDEELATLARNTREAALANLKEAGFVLVPVEPTEAMVERGAKVLSLQRHGSSASGHSAQAFDWMLNADKYRTISEKVGRAMLAASEVG